MKRILFALAILFSGNAIAQVTVMPKGVPFTTVKKQHLQIYNTDYDSTKNIAIWNDGDIYGTNYEEIHYRATGNRRFKITNITPNTNIMLYPTTGYHLMMPLKIISKSDTTLREVILKSN